MDRLNRGSGPATNMENIILDVREQDEFAAEHIAGSVWVPLSQFAHMAPGVLQGMTGKKVIIMCRGGNRARLAKEQVNRLGFGGQIKTEVYAGGLVEWKKRGNPVVTGKTGRLPIMRQVQILTGALVLSSALLSLAFNPRVAWVAAFVGAGLVFAGITGFCGLALLLAAMPWNKTKPETGCNGGCCG